MAKQSNEFISSARKISQTTSACGKMHAMAADVEEVLHKTLRSVPYK